MVALQPVVPFTRQQRSIVIDTSLNRFPTRPQVVGKLREYYTFPAFQQPNVWRGASEILLRFDFTGSQTSILNAFPITPPDDANFCPVLSWLKDEVYYRYKLWWDVGEILWLPHYAKQKIPNVEFFSIEIWNTNTTVGLGLEGGGGGLGMEGGGLLGLENIIVDLILSEDIRFYGSRLHFPTAPYCDLSDLSLGGPTQCVDPIYHLENFEPLYGDYYLLVSPCTRQLIKGVKAKPTYNLLKNRSDNTWHKVWAHLVDGNVSLEVDPTNEVPPAAALGYFPMVKGGGGLTYKFELENDIDGTGNYFVMDTQVASSVLDLNVALLQDIDNPDDAHLYGFLLVPAEGGGLTYRVIQNIIAP